MVKIKEGDYIFVEWLDSCGGAGWIHQVHIDIDQKI